MDVAKKATFKALLKECKNLPTLPGIVGKLATMAEDPNTSTDQIGKVISKDHILSAKLLRLVNSAFYGFPQRISSLSSAIILLGFSVVKSLIITASIFEFMEEQDIELWEHSLGCAVVCSVVAKRMGIADPEEVSTAGLIHDIGKVAIKMELPKEYAEIIAIMQKDNVTIRVAEKQVLGFDHAEAGGWLTKSWNLPDKLVEPITFHHNPRMASKNSQLTSCIIHFSDILIRGMGYCHGGDNKVPVLSKNAWKMLNLNKQDIDAIIDEVEEKLWDVKGFSLEVQQSPDTNISNKEVS